LGGQLIRFGVFEADLEGGELRKQGLKIRLQEQPFQVLAMLLERSGQIVTRDELQKKLWTADTFVDFDRGLNKAINRLREALEDSAENPRFIETVPKRGYRFIAPVDQEQTGADAEPHPPAKAPMREKVAWGLALALLAASILLAMAYFRSSPPATQMLRSSLLPPANTSFQPYNFAISPDGTRLAFVAVDREGRSMLWVRSLSATGAQQINGTDGATYPFWSPDNRRIGFFAQRKLKTVDIASGEVRVLCDVASGHGGAWNRDGVIVFSPSVAGPLYRVDASGGTPVLATPTPRQGSGQEHCLPSFLPDGKHFLYNVLHSVNADSLGNGIYIGTLGSTDARLLSSALAGNVAFSSGRLLHVRDRSLVAQPFDVQNLQLSGSFASIAEQELDSDPTFSLSGFTVSENGVLVFQSTADSSTRLLWFDRSGKELGPLSEGAYKDPSFSPDGRLLAVSSDDARNGRYCIRVHDLARGVTARLTDGGNESYPTWSRDGKQITYTSYDDKIFYMYRVSADGSGSSQMLRKGAFMGPEDWSPDGRLVFMTLERGLPFLTIYSAADQSVTPFAPGAEAQFSPDGKWIAYIGQGGVAGGGGIVVQPYPGPGPHVQISGAGGAQPRWSRDGRQIFYVAPDRKLMAVGFDLKNGTATTPRIVFQTRIVAPNLVRFQYDVASDSRFLINSFPSGSSSPLTMVTGWKTAR
jgi:Tol biopolymer transport system component/DNA-binding winged helix-turn-helix (wHTH) protein